MARRLAGSPIPHHGSARRAKVPPSRPDRVASSDPVRRVIFCLVVPRIAEILQSAHAFDPRAPMTTDLRPAVDALFDELEAKGVDYVLVGGVALLSYIEGRNTQDIDLIVSAGDLAKLPWDAKAQDADFARATYRGVRVDLLLRNNALFDEVARTARTTVAFQGRPVVTATREGLLLLKLYALPSLYRTANLARAALYETDVLMLHTRAPPWTTRRSSNGSGPIFRVTTSPSSAAFSTSSAPGRGSPDARGAWPTASRPHGRRGS